MNKTTEKQESYDEIKRERNTLISIIEGMLASATPNPKEHPAMFAAWTAAQAALTTIL